MSWVPSLPMLRLFVGVATAKGFSSAARALNVSQPALSRSIRMLESGLGTTLFDRDTRNVHLTVAGEALLPVAQRLLADVDHAFSELSLSLSGERGRIAVGALPSVAAGFLSDVIAAFRETHPAVEIAIIDSLAGAIETQFRQRQIDVALIASTQISDELEFTPIFQEEFGLVCRADDPLAEQSALSWETFAERPFIAMAPLSSVRRTTDATFARTGRNIKPLFECAHIATLGGLIAQDLGISALPKSAVPLLARDKLVWRRLSEPLVIRTIGVARWRNLTLSPAAEAFSRAVIAFSTIAGAAKSAASFAR